MELLVEPANKASRSVVEHLGATLEGVLPEPEVIQDTSRQTVRYALTSENLTA